MVPPKRPAVPRACPPGIVSMMQDCWLSDPEQRLTAEELEARLCALSSTECEPLQHCGPGGRHVSSRNVVRRRASTNTRPPPQIKIVNSLLYSGFTSAMYEGTDVLAALHRQLGSGTQGGSEERMFDLLCDTFPRCRSFVDLSLYMFPCVCVCVCVCVCAHICVCIYVRTHTHLVLVDPICTPPHRAVWRRAKRARAHAHTCIHTHKYTNTYAHAHTLSLSLSLSRSLSLSLSLALSLFPPPLSLSLSHTHSLSLTLSRSLARSLSYTQPCGRYHSCGPAGGA